eukprot:10574-Heterococcus_DN1.PRE.5
MPVAVYLLKAGDYQAAITDTTQYSIIWCAASVTQEWLFCRPGGQHYRRYAATTEKTTQTVHDCRPSLLSNTITIQQRSSPFTLLNVTDRHVGRFSELAYDAVIAMACYVVQVQAVESAASTVWKHADS